MPVSKVMYAIFLCCCYEGQTESSFVGLLGAILLIVVMCFQ